MGNYRLNRKIEGLLSKKEGKDMVKVKNTYTCKKKSVLFIRNFLKACILLNKRSKWNDIASNWNKTEFDWNAK